MDRASRSAATVARLRTVLRMLAGFRRPRRRRGRRPRNRDRRRRRAHRRQTSTAMRMHRRGSTDGDPGRRMHGADSPSGRRIRSPGRPGHRAAAHQVPMEMVDRLPAPLADVADQPIAALGDALASRDIAPPRGRAVRGARPSASVRSRTDGMWSRGRMRMWVGARGAMSRKATTRSSSWTRRRWQLTGDDAAEETGGVAHRRPRYQSAGFVLMRKAMRPTASAMT